MNNVWSLRGIVPALLLALPATAANWPQFRGERASGVETSAPAVTRLDVETNQNVRRRTPIPGLAHASPIVWGDRIYTTTAVWPGRASLKVGLYGDIGSANDQYEHEWRLLALDQATGKVLSDKLGYKGTPRVKRHTKASHCNSTP